MDMAYAVHVVSRAENLRGVIGNRPFVVAGKGVTVTISVGLPCPMNSAIAAWMKS